MASTLPQPPRTNRLSRHVETNEKKGRMEIVILQKPPYEPSSGPPLPRARLLPIHDSTAYIVERILLPPEEIAADGKPKPKRMTYIVGWRDLPAATLLVPAMDILEYVSPRELEDWETALEKELSEDRARLHEEKQKIQQAEKVPGGKIHVKPATGKRKRGRLPAHANIESAAAAELETDEDAKGRLMGGALSLSTPQKKRMKDFEGLSDEEGSPSRQLEEAFYEAETGRDVTVPGFGGDDGGAMQAEWSDAQGNEAYAQFGGTVHVPPLEYQDANLSSDDIPARIQDPAAAQPGPSWASKKSPSKRLEANSPSRRPANSFKPAGVATSHLANEELHEASLGTSSASPFPDFDIPATKSKRSRPNPTKKPKKRKKDSDAQQPVNVDGEDQWVIKRIEDDELFEVEGREGTVLYYKVRWEGDWPPDQNPSWEPAENLPPHAIRNYKKQGKGRKKSTISRPKPSGPGGEPKKRKSEKKQTTLPWAGGRKYSSVSEAFTGEADISTFGMIQQTGDGILDNNHQDEEDDNDELLVVDDSQTTSNQTRPLWRGQGNGLLGILGASRA